MRLKMKTRQHMLMLLVILSCILMPSLAACQFGGSQPTTHVANKATGVAAKPVCTSNIPTNATHYWPLDTHGFQGIFQFLGQTNPKNASNPSISGANLEWSWAKIEPVEGQYDW